LEYYRKGRAPWSKGRDTLVPPSAGSRGKFLGGEQEGGKAGIGGGKKSWKPCGGNGGGSPMARGVRVAGSLPRGDHNVIR